METPNDVKIIQTDVGNKDGQNKCPKCGATEITLNVNTGKLRCNFCRCEFSPNKLDSMEKDIANLKGKIIGSGATDIVADSNEVMTFKCSSCGAEVVVDTSSSTQARCHWCRSTLSVNQQIPNGAIPDAVLPFNVKKDEAKELISSFVNKRKFFANPKFKQEFTAQNIMGVYFPYMLVDINSHANLIGLGEHQTRRYTRGSGENQKTYYDADLYNVEREFDLVINGLSVEASSDKLNDSDDKTNNIINSIMPFDVENCVKYDSNYLKGFTSERRDVNSEQLKNLVNIQAKDIARYAANDTLKFYDRGVKWNQENFNIIGEQWMSAYLPVWLYSYQQEKKDKKILHYVAVNARTKEVMGSVPIHMPKLFIVSFIVEILGLMATMFVDSDYSWIFLFAGIVYFFIMYARYRNNDARHTYEVDTKKQISNLRQVDDFVKHQTGLTNSMMQGANNTNVVGKTEGSKIYDAMLGNSSDSVINTVVKNNNVANFIKDNINKE